MFAYEAPVMKHLYELKVISDFAAAHNLRNFRGKCENLHGHNWRIEVVVRGTELDQSGVVVDFGEVKQVIRDLLSEIDHKYLNDLPYFTTHNPSSENIARYLFDRLSEQANKGSRWIHSVTAWESDDACATYLKTEH
jgi:6-pyruvoyltetrahydropterin/6-carboxytetrahydropterin synthase